MGGVIKEVLAGSPVIIGPVVKGFGEVVTAIGSVVGGLVMMGGATKGVFEVFGSLVHVIGNVVGVMGDLVAKTALAALGLGGAAVLAVYGLTKKAGDFDAAVNRAKLNFGEYAETVVKQAEKMATAFGVSKAMYVRSADQFGASSSRWATARRMWRRCL